VSLTNRDKKIVLLLLPLVLVGAFWFLVLKPKRQEAAKLTDQVTQAEEARDAAVSQANQLQAAKAKYASQYAEMVRLGKALPTKVDMPSLLVQLNEAAKGTGIEFGSIQVGQRATAAAVAPSSTGGTGSATAFGAAVQKARAANAAESSSVAQSAAASNSVGTTGATGASGAASTGTAAGSTTSALDQVPLTFKFGGTFFDLADFFHHLKRFVHVANDKIKVQGRLITIDSLKFTSTTFPSIEADVTATVYLTPKNDVAVAAAAATGAQGQQSAAISAVNSGSSSSSSSTASSGSGTQ
jgi:Pilus assembly protein, PilO